MSILGLLSVLQPSVLDAALPPEVGTGLPQLLSGIMRLLLDLKTQQEEAENAASTEEEEEEEEVGGGGWGTGVSCRGQAG